MEWEETFGHGKRRIATFRAHVSERATFCYHCGTILPPGNTCPECGMVWERLFTPGITDDDGFFEKSACPECKPDWNHWQHLYPPTYAKGDGNRVLVAEGVAECEADHVLLYRWTPTGFTYTGSSGKRITVPLEDIRGQS